MIVGDSLLTALIWVVAIEAGLIVVFAAAVFLHAFWLEREQRRRKPLVERALKVIRKEISGETATEEDSTFFGALEFDLLVEVASRLAPNLALHHRASLFNAAHRLGLVRRAEQECLRRRWWRRLHGVRLLTLFGGGQDVVPLLLQDRSAAVRAQVASWAADHPTPTVLFQLILMLADRAPIVRFTVQDSLLRIGHAAIDPLSAYLAEVDPRANRADAMVVAIGLADSRFVPSAVHAAWDPSPVVRRLAAELLGSLGGDDGVAVLVTLLDDSDASVRAAATRSVARLGHWPAAARVATLLTDHAWIVRREAAIALRNLGPPGQMLLRRSLRSADPFAADMARQVLELPAASTDVLTA